MRFITRMAVIVILLTPELTAAPCLFGIGNCPSGFVRLYPLSLQQNRPSPNQFVAGPGQGYLRIQADTDTTAMATNERLQRLDRGLQYLSVTAEVALPGGSSPEYPLVLYDLINRKEVTVVSYGLAHGEYIDLQSGFQPTVVIHVRAVPQTIGNAYLRAFQKVDDYLKNTPAKALFAATPQLALATNVLGSFAQAAIADQNKEWESTKTIGLSSSSDAILPLTGEPVILFLVPTTQYDAEQLRSGNFTIQKHRVFRDNKPFDDVPYVILTASTSNYRPLTPDFIQTPLSCLSSEADVADVENLLQHGSLSPVQREYERQIVNRLKILQNVRNADTQKSIDKIADNAYALLSLQQPDDAMWKSNYSTLSSALTNCIDSAFNGVLAADRWSRIKQAINETKTWQEKANKAQAAARKDTLEQSLKIVVMPIKTYSLSNGDAYDYLTNVRDDIEAQLQPYYDQIAAAARQASTVAQRNQLGSELNAEISTTDCLQCKETLKAVLTDLAGANALATAQAQLVDAQKRVAQLQSELADKLGTAEAVAAVAKQTNAAAPAAAQLQQEVSTSSALLSVVHPSENDLRAAIQRVDSNTTAVQTQLTKPNPE